MDNKQIRNLAEQAVLQQRKQSGDQAAKIIDGVFDQLVVQPKIHDTAKLPETIFKETFLPLFTGEIPKEESHSLLGQWIGIAGSPMAEVNVINETGESLFTVPPMMDSSVIETVRRNIGESFSDIYSQYKMHSNNIPIVGDRFLDNALLHKANQTLKTPSVVQENADRWQDIFDKYGKKLPGKTASEKVAKTLNPADDVEYD